jgi:hypothetical protein
MSGRGGQQISGDFNHFFFFFKLKNRPLGDRGAPQNLFYHKSYFFCDLKPHAKFGNPAITPSGRKVTRRREEEIKPLIVDA